MVHSGDLMSILDWEKMSQEIEINQGKNIADACKATNVERFIWSSLPNVSKGSLPYRLGCSSLEADLKTETHGKFTLVRHFDSKAKVEEYTRSIGVPSSFFMPGPFMGMFLGMLRKVTSINFLICGIS
jgi:NmrA-like family